MKNSHIFQRRCIFEWSVNELLLSQELPVLFSYIVPLEWRGKSNELI